MITTDPIADMLTRIRNAAAAGKTEVRLPYSKMKEQIAKILVGDGYIVALSSEEQGGFRQLVLDIDQ